MLTLAHFLSLGAILFCLSVAGIFLNRKNVIIILMCIELMLLAVNMNFVAFSRFLGNLDGQIFVFFIVTVAAAEADDGPILYRGGPQRAGLFEATGPANLYGALWEHETQSDIRTAPLIVGERLFFGAHDGYVYALDKAAGKQVRLVAVEPASCPTLTKGRYAWDYGDVAGNEFGAQSTLVHR